MQTCKKIMIGWVLSYKHSEKVANEAKFPRCEVESGVAAYVNKCESASLG
ncbi:hypothetical protein HBI56_094620 [Parastagonospora nodorum]|uniref:Uncharacterized protein n=1 Tax=Phaeosphaeria nodorum (strain SN15 / ATCC MYA-4574 / FGSC 10173) TaxID=321614 RepID=A0A7U2F7Z6_PHANO|nr:hypothetical protein HBH56_089910 [Parastagonospora nodorum]QRC98180.1 hypothetical protein JI435_411660 [Parastagonospora nodorum SN15]KAH3936075.1 hypothetical protein HBH54_024550 [Parastagonospora nodorum]KAH3945810.1 hypothetical protein HBH53_141650 [Parastagonospora nodorum]KAH3966180.1 hypothetical protein HBH51_143720 [Parastagonospora nodorum]